MISTSPFYRFSLSLATLLLAWACIGSVTESRAQSPVLPRVAIRTSFFSVDESAGKVAIPVMLLDAATAPVTVTVAVRALGTTATEGEDFTLDTTTVTFAPGEVEKTLLLSLVDDSTIEPTETAVIELTAATGAEIANPPDSGLENICNVQIKDNDEKPFVVFTKSNVEVNEGQASVRLFAQLSWPSTQEIVVPFMIDSAASLRNPLASVPDDLGPLPEAVRFAPGSTWQEIVIPIAQDTVVEPTEEIAVELCVPGSIINVGIVEGVLGPPLLFTVDPSNLSFRLNAGEVGAVCHISIIDNDAQPSSQRLTTWQTTGPAITRQHLHGIVWTGTQYIAVGDAGTVITSPDSVTWTAQNSGTKGGLSSIAWSGSEAVAVGNGVAIRSSDGRLWTVQNAPVPMILLNIAVTNVYGGGAVTPPPYTAHSLPFFEGAASVVWTGRQFVSMSSNGVIGISADGLVWKACGQQTWGSATDLLWTGSELQGITLLSNSSFSLDCALFSSDGSANWSRRASTLPAQWWNYYPWILSGIIGTGTEYPTVQSAQVSASLGYRGGAPAGEPKWLAAFRGGAAPGLYASSEAAPFSTIAASQVSSQGFDDVLWTGSQWIAVGDRIATSADGISWNVTDHAGDAALHGVVSGGGKTVAVGDYGAVVVLPEPAEQPVTASLVTINQSMKDVVWAGTQYVAVGSGGVILTSPDGVAWTARNSGTTETLHAVAWQEHLVAIGGNPSLHSDIYHTLVVVGAAGTVLTSDNEGVTWSIARSGTTNELRGVVFAALGGLRFGDGEFIAVGADRTVLSSTDGRSWTVRSLPMLPSARLAVASSSMVVANTSIAMPIFWYPPRIDNGDTTASGMLEDVTWTGTQLVAVGSQDSVFTSPDGVTWTQHSISHESRWTLDSYSGWTNNPVSDLKRVVWDGSKLVAAGTNGSVVTSEDGRTWEDQNTGLYTNYWGYPYYAIAAVQASGPGFTTNDTGMIATSNKLVSPSLSVSTSMLSIPYYYFNSQPETLRGLAVMPDGLVAVGSFGRVLSSTDGSAWLTENTATTLNLNAVAVHNGQTVAVGDQGLFLLNQSTASQPTVSWTTTSVQVDEAETTVTLTAQLSSALLQPLDVSVTTRGTAQSDYVAPYSSQNMDFAVEGGSGTYQANIGNLHFDEGVTSATITFTIHDDAQQEGDETIFASLSPPNDGTVQAWANRVASIVIRANDQRPTILTESGDAVITTGQTFTFAVTAKSMGGTLSYQWYEGDYGHEVAIADGTSAGLTVSDTQVSAARHFRVEVSNGQGTANSYFQLVVVEAGQGGNVTALEGEDVTLQVHLPSTYLWPWWRHDETYVDYYGQSNASITNDGKALTLSRLQVSDSGTYTCTLQLPQIAYLRIWGWPSGPNRDAPTSLEISFNLTVSPVTNPPVMVVTVPPAGIVGVPYALALSASENPAQFTATGLPTGLLINTKTGLISGRPTQAGTFNVNVSANNRAGTSATLALVITIAPQPFTEAVGTYTGLLVISSDPPLSGRIDFNVASGGKILGKLTTGNKSYPFTSQLIDTEGRLTFDCAAAGSISAFTCEINATENTFANYIAPQALNLSGIVNNNSGANLTLTSISNNYLTPVDAGSLTRTLYRNAKSTISTGATQTTNLSNFNLPGSGALVQINSVVALSVSPTLSVRGWRKVWNKTHPVTDRTGYFTALLAPPSALTGKTLSDTTSRGSGSLAGTVNVDGTLVSKGRLADGSAWVGSTFMGPKGEIAVYQNLDARSSTVSGALEISAARVVNGELTWLNVPRRSAASRTAGAADTTTLTVTGGGYSPTKAQPIPGLVAPGNAVVTFSDGGLATPVSVNMTLGNRGLATVSGANPYRVWLVFEPKTGIFSAGLNPVLGKQRRVSAMGIFSQDDQGFLGGGAFTNPGGPSGNIQIIAAPSP